MKVSKYFAIACAALMVSACADEVKDIIAPDTPKEEGSKEEGNEVVDMIPITVTVTETSSRVSHIESDNVITVAWEADDVIYLGSPAADASDILINAEGSGFTTLTVKEGSISENGKTASFTGVIPADLKGKTLLAFYGKTENLKVKNSQVIMDFTQQTQSAAGLSHLTDYDLMSAVVTNYDGSENINLQFKHEGSIFKVKLTQIPTGESISKVLLSLPEGTNSFVTTKTFSTDGQASNGDMTNNLELNVGSISDSNYEAVFTLCPTTLNSSMSISVPITNSKGVYSYTDNLNFSNVTLESGKYYWTPELVLEQDNSLKGTGTSESPYIIDNVDKFNKIADATDAYYTTTQDMDFTGVTFTPISTFSGTLDGNGKTISNLTFTVGDGNGGIFGTNNGTIKNLTVDGGTVTKTGNLDNNEGTGILAGVNNNNISNCIIKNSSLSASLSSKGADVGIGLLVGTNNSGKTISECTVDASSISINNSKECHVGGLVGFNLTGNIEFSSVKPTTNIDYTATVAGGNIGGLIGRNKGGTIKGCSTNIDINTTGCNLGLKIAGFIGDAFFGSPTTIQGCYTTGTLTFRSDTHTYGGFTGSFGGDGKKELTNCYTSLNFIGNTDHAFVGQNPSNVIATDCYFTEGTQSEDLSIKNVVSSTASELKNKLSTFNNLGWDNYEFAIGPSDDEPLIIQKKQ